MLRATLTKSKACPFPNSSSAFSRYFMAFLWSWASLVAIAFILKRNPLSTPFFCCFTDSSSKSLWICFCISYPFLCCSVSSMSYFGRWLWSKSEDAVSEVLRYFIRRECLIREGDSCLLWAVGNVSLCNNRSIFNLEDNQIND